MAKKLSEQVKEVVREKKVKSKKKERLLTGSTLRDIVLGGAPGVYGIQTGVIWNVIGVSGGGKTFESTELIAVNRALLKDKFKFHYDDAELGNEVDCVKLYGFDLMKESLLKKKNKGGIEEPVRSKTVEELHMNIKKFLYKLNKDDIGCYILDSLDALISNEVKDIIEQREKKFDKNEEYDEGSYYMQKARYLKFEMFPDIKPLIEESNCLLIITSQQSEKINVTHGSRKDRAGGKALRFFAHYESWMRELEKIKVTVKGDTRTIGARFIEDFTKTRNPRPFRQCKTTIFFEYGISDIDSNLDFVFNLLTDTGRDKTGKDSKLGLKDCLEFFKDNTNEFFEIFKNKRMLKKELDKIEDIKKDQNYWWILKPDLIEYIENNNLEEKLKKMVIDKWEDIENKIKIERKRKY